MTNPSDTTDTTDTTNPATAIIRPARQTDLPALVQLIAGIAEFEKLTHKLEVTEAKLRDALFCDHPHALCFVVTRADQVVGYTTLFYTFSSFQGRYGLYIDDLYIDPAHRSGGLGQQMMRYIAQYATSQNLGRLEWMVLDWNRRAIDFYETLGAEALSDWVSYRVEAHQLQQLANA
ncbi:MAG: GNAT family N-acetyltransferase [Cyanobacteria bacterium HKST-UBA05]|nr:GNAT family N-acetyltransferase [Cyanobacteria bacterium HKST-UBA05]